MYDIFRTMLDRNGIGSPTEVRTSNYGSVPEIPEFPATSSHPGALLQIPAEALLRGTVATRSKKSTLICLDGKEPEVFIPDTSYLS